MEQSFYQTLFANDAFAMSVGRLVLSSARLESSIKAFMDSHGTASADKKAPLGAIIKTLTTHHAIDRTAIEHLPFILNQRNYFVHKLHANLSDYPGNHADAMQFTSRAKSLSDEMEFFSDLFISHCKPTAS
jgi:hypothetical protein